MFINDSIEYLKFEGLRDLEYAREFHFCMSYCSYPDYLWRGWRGFNIECLDRNMPPNRDSFLKIFWGRFRKGILIIK